MKSPYLGLIKSLAHGSVEALQRHKLATGLATVTAIVLILLAVASRSDGLHHYPEFILPRLLRLETSFLASLRSAENTSGEWRGYYFETRTDRLKIFSGSPGWIV